MFMDEMFGMEKRRKASYAFLGAATKLAPFVLVITTLLCAGLAIHRVPTQNVGVFAQASGEVNQSKSLPTRVHAGYWLASADGGVFAYGAPHAGAVTGRLGDDRVVAMARSASGDGYWLAGEKGGVFAHGDAQFFGTATPPLNAPITGIASLPNGKGYWLASADGGVFSFGEATFFGARNGAALRAPIVDIAATATGRGYWLVAADGGVFAYGDALFFGVPKSPLQQPVVSITPTLSGKGYWLLASDGGVFAFGDAKFFGSTVNANSSAAVGLAPQANGDGYWIAFADGNTRAFHCTSLQYSSIPGLQQPIVAIIAASAPRKSGDVEVVAGTQQAGFSGDGNTAIDAQFNKPSAVVKDASGNLYIADTANNRVRRIDSNGIVSTIVGTGEPGFAGDGREARKARLQRPTGLAFDPHGNLYIADGGNSRIRKVDNNGDINTIAGNGRAGFSGDDGLAVRARLNDPRDVSVDKHGNLYIADAKNCRVRKVDNAGVISTFAGNGKCAIGATGVAAKSAQLAPFRLTITSDDVLFVADVHQQRVHRIGADGIVSTFAQTGKASSNQRAKSTDESKGIVAVAPLPNGRVAFADSATKQIVFAMSGKADQDFAMQDLDNRGNTVADAGLYFDGAASLFACDSQGSAVLRITVLPE